MIKLILMAALLFVSGASMAQRVVVGKNGEAIIDNRAMPAGAITAVKKARVVPADNPNTTDNIASAESNKTVSHYFEVMKTDYNNGVSWLTAIQGCANYDDNTWRLPTQRELQLIWTLHVPLRNKVTDFVSFSAKNYWSATEGGTGTSWYVYFNSNDGNTFNYDKTTSCWVRCIRDLDPQ